MQPINSCLFFCVVALIACEKQPERQYFLTQIVSTIVFEHDEKKVAELIKQGANVNAPERNGRTALMYAAGVHISVSDREISEADRHPQSGENIAMVRLLLDSGANPNAVSSSGDTALVAAIYHGRVETARLLLERGADPNLAYGSHGNTPLMISAYRCYDDLTTLLLQHGADKSLKSVSGDTVESFARRGECPDTMIDLVGEPTELGSRQK